MEQSLEELVWLSGWARRLGVSFILELTGDAAEKLAHTERWTAVRDQLPKGWVGGTRVTRSGRRGDGVWMPVPGVPFAPGPESPGSWRESVVRMTRQHVSAVDQLLGQGLNRVLELEIPPVAGLVLSRFALRLIPEDREALFQGSSASATRDADGGLRLRPVGQLGNPRDRAGCEGSLAGLISRIGSAMTRPQQGAEAPRIQLILTRCDARSQRMLVHRFFSWIEDSGIGRVSFPGLDRLFHPTAIPVVGLPYPGPYDVQIEVTRLRRASQHPGSLGSDPDRDLEALLLWAEGLELENPVRFGRLLAPGWRGALEDAVLQGDSTALYGDIRRLIPRLESIARGDELGAHPTDKHDDTPPASVDRMQR